MSALDEIFEFVSLTTAKKTLRRLRARSGRVGKRIERGTGDITDDDISNMGGGMAVADIPEAGPFRNTAHVARNINAPALGMKGKMKNPRNMGIHEEGHLADKMNSRIATAINREQERNIAKYQAEEAKILTGKGGDISAIIKSGDKINRINTKREVRANRRALKEMKAAGGSKADIAEYKAWAQNQMKQGYRNPFFEDLMSRENNPSLKTAKSVLRKNPYLRRVDLKSLEEIFYA